MGRMVGERRRTAGARFSGDTSPWRTRLARRHCVSPRLPLGFNAQHPRPSRDSATPYDHAEKDQEQANRAALLEECDRLHRKGMETRQEEARD